MITKAEVYKSVINIQKETGQGLSGIVKIKSSEYAKYLDELIEEGLVKACKTGGSLGHPETDIFYMPTKGYNVWEDEGTDGVYSRYKGRYLHFVRLYLGIIPLQHGSMIEPGLLAYTQNPEIMQKYCEWLTRNEVALMEMLALDNQYPGDDSDDTTTIGLSPDEIAFIKNKSWYVANKTIADCLKSSIEGQADDDGIISINRQLIDLYKTDLDKYGDDLKQSEKEVNNIKVWRHNVNRWLQSQDGNLSIQSVIQ